MDFTIIGYGRMGTLLKKELEKQYLDIWKTIGKNDWSCDSLEGVGEAIVFVSPDAGYKVTTRLLKAGVRNIAVGTTGFYSNPDGSENKEMLQEFEKLAIKNGCSLLLSPNFAVGVNIFYKVVKTTAEMCARTGYDPSVHEFHHKNKADRPSGTAIMIGKILLEAYAGTKTSLNYGQKSGKRKDSEIDIIAIRGGNNPGEHRVRFVSEKDTIELVHRAEDPRIFVGGAIKAIFWLDKQKPGRYEMKDML